MKRLLLNKITFLRKNPYILLILCAFIILVASLGVPLKDFVGGCGSDDSSEDDAADMAERDEIERIMSSETQSEAEKLEAIKGLIASGATRCSGEAQGAVPEGLEAIEVTDGEGEVRVRAGGKEYLFVNNPFPSVTLSDGRLLFTQNPKLNIIVNGKSVETSGGSIIVRKKCPSIVRLYYYVPISHNGSLIAYIDIELNGKIKTEFRIASYPKREITKLEYLFNLKKYGTLFSVSEMTCDSGTQGCTRGEGSTEEEMQNGLTSYNTLNPVLYLKSGNVGSGWMAEMCSAGNTPPIVIDNSRVEEATLSIKPCGSPVTVKKGFTLRNTISFLPEELQHSLSCNDEPNPPPAQNVCLDPEKRAMVYMLFENVRDNHFSAERFAGWFRQRDWEGQDNALYTLQGVLMPVIKAAVACSDYALMDEIAMVILRPFIHLEERTTIHRANPRPDVYWEESDLKYPIRTWTYDYHDTDAGNNVWREIEYFHGTTQAMYLFAYALHHFAEVPQASRGANILEYINRYASLVTHDFLERWVLVEPDSEFDHNYNPYGMFSRAGGPCNPGTYNHKDSVMHILNEDFGTDRMGTRVLGSAKDCNALFDGDMFILASVPELLAANAADPIRVPLTHEQLTGFREYAQLGTRLLEQRLDPVTVSDFNGTNRPALLFEKGRWDDYNSDGEYDFIGYTEADRFPTNNDVNHAPGHCWDLSHAVRYVHLFNSYHENRNVTGSCFPDREVMTKLANQVAYGISNGNMERPLFTNFFDGSNGWYRVDIAARTGFPPWTMSSAFSLYGSWARFNPDIRRLQDRLFEMMKQSVFVPDVTGKGQILTLVKTDDGAKPQAQSVAGYSGLALRRTGNGLRTQVKLDNDGAVSLMAWVRFEANAAVNSDHTIAGFTDGMLRTKGGKWAYYWADEGCGRDLGDYRSDVDVTANGEWTHVGYSRTTEGMVSLYVGGIRIGGVPGTPNPHCPLVVAGWGNYRLMNGDIDELRVYGRVMTAEEFSIAARGTPPADNGDLKAYWNFDTAIDNNIAAHFDRYYGGAYRAGELINTQDYNLSTSLSMMMTLASYANE